MTSYKFTDTAAVDAAQLTDISDMLPRLAADLQEDYNNFDLPDGIDEIAYELVCDHPEDPAKAFRQIAASFATENFLRSGAWLYQDCVEWFHKRYPEIKGVTAKNTYIAVVFDPSIITRDPHEPIPLADLTDEGRSALYDPGMDTEQYDYRVG